MYIGHIKHVCIGKESRCTILLYADCPLGYDDMMFTCCGFCFKPGSNPYKDKVSSRIRSVFVHPT